MDPRAAASCEWLRCPWSLERYAPSFHPDGSSWLDKPAEGK